MLSHIRAKITEEIAREDHGVLSTVGPAGLQAGRFACEALGTNLYLLVPATSDMCHNLEASSAVIVTAEGWQVRGKARILPEEARPVSLRLLGLPESRWAALVEVSLQLFEKACLRGWGFVESYDLEESEKEE